MNKLYNYVRNCNTAKNQRSVIALNAGLFNNMSRYRATNYRQQTKLPNGMPAGACLLTACLIICHVIEPQIIGCKQNCQTNLLQGFPAACLFNNMSRYRATNYRQQTKLPNEFAAGLPCCLLIVI